MWLLILILFVHWLADFVFQSDMMAQNKSKSLKWLGIHVLTYSTILLIFGWKFALVNGSLHFVIDFFTSKATSRLWEKKQVHWFFVVIGFDQFLHASCLLLTAKYLFQ